MTALRYGRCARCETIHSGPVLPDRCWVCGGSEVRDITASLDRDDYFTRGLRRR